jgi:hypothetical protein
MIRQGCPRCGASVIRAIDYAYGTVIADVRPLTPEQELAVRVEHLAHGTRPRMTFGIRAEGSLSSRMMIEPRIDGTYYPHLHRAVVAEHRCHSWTAAQLPSPKHVERVMPGADDEPPYPPLAEQHAPWPDDTPDEVILATLAAYLVPKAGRCIGCGLRVTGKRSSCSTCSAHHHGRLFGAEGPTSGWCQTGRHRRRTAMIDTEGRWSCGPCQAKGARVPSRP